ncbi:cell wall hydrolase [Rhodovulum sp. DZ06]|uniref:cell wall hydrolase n=1 Tax=Rhodovulum sp. DZ06 TaxID=3425126 RepID=UPI003D32934D
MPSPPFPRLAALALALAPLLPGTAGAQQPPAARPDAPAAPAAAALPGDLPLDAPLVCLARAVYFEARGRGPEELSAVAHVIVNRRGDPQFPPTVCDVVKEGGPQAPCQFSWWCDGRPDKARNAKEYAEATRAARDALSGASKDPTGGANLFHAARIKPPRWTRSAQDMGKIGAHRFWRLEKR